jgi:hypothetical protein
MKLAASRIEQGKKLKGAAGNTAHHKDVGASDLVTLTKKTSAFESMSPTIGDGTDDGDAAATSTSKTVSFGGYARGAAMHLTRQVVAKPLSLVADVAGGASSVIDSVTSSSTATASVSNAVKQRDVGGAVTETIRGGVGLALSPAVKGLALVSATAKKMEHASTAVASRLEGMTTTETIGGPHNSYILAPSKLGPAVGKFQTLRPPRVFYYYGGHFPMGTHHDSSGQGCDEQQQDSGPVVASQRLDEVGRSGVVTAIAVQVLGACIRTTHQGGESGHSLHDGATSCMARIAVKLVRSWDGKELARRTTSVIASERTQPRDLAGSLNVSKCQHPGSPNEAAWNWHAAIFYFDVSDFETQVFGHDLRIDFEVFADEGGDTLVNAEEQHSTNYVDGVRNSSTGSDATLGSGSNRKFGLAGMLKSSQDHSRWSQLRLQGVAGIRVAEAMIDPDLVAGHLAMARAGPFFESSRQAKKDALAIGISEYQSWSTDTDMRDSDSDSDSESKPKTEADADAKAESSGQDFGVENNFSGPLNNAGDRRSKRWGSLSTNVGSESPLLRSGTLAKRGSRRKNWRIRHFELRDKELLYYHERKRGTVDALVLKGSFDFKKYFIYSCEEVTGKPADRVGGSFGFMFKITSVDTRKVNSLKTRKTFASTEATTSLLMSAASREDRAAWMSAIRTALWALDASGPNSVVARDKCRRHHVVPSSSSYDKLPNSNSVVIPSLPQISKRYPLANSRGSVSAKILLYQTGRRTRLSFAPRNGDR